MVVVIGQSLRKCVMKFLRSSLMPSWGLGPHDQSMKMPSINGPAFTQVRAIWRKMIHCRHVFSALYPIINVISWNLATSQRRSLVRPNLIGSGCHILKNCLRNSKWQIILYSHISLFTMVVYRVELCHNRKSCKIFASCVFPPQKTMHSCILAHDLRKNAKFRHLFC